MRASQVIPGRITENPRCPRCDYDQRGTVDAWDDSCPVSGLCPECGYNFHWSDVMRPDRHRCPGFFEHERGLWRSLVAAWRTLLWALLPMVFWTRVRMHHEVKVRRVLLWPVVAFGSIWGLVVVGRLIAFFGDGLYRLPFKTALAEASNAVVFPVLMVYSARWGGGAPGLIRIDAMILGWSPVFYGVLGQAVCVPVLLMLLPVTRKRAKIRKAHVLRAAVYGQAWFACHLCVLLLTAVLGAIMTDYDIAIGWDGPVLAGLEELAFIWGLLLAMWIAVWWWCVLRLGFRMPQATRHWLVLMFAALLVFAIGLASDWRLARTLFWMV